MVKVENLHKTFGNLKVLKGVSFCVAPGEVVVIVGPSGSGKSTLLRCINFLEIPDSGSVEIDDIFVNSEHYTQNEIKALRAKTSMVFQNYSAFKNKTVLENVMLPMTAVQKIKKDIAQQTALELIDKVGLSDKIHEYPARLSGGQQQRVGIARALAVNPKVILFDEPTSSLDPELVAGILNIIKDLAAEHNRTLLIVTHEMRFAREVADRVLFMDSGTILESGTPDMFFNHPQNERTKAFINLIN